MKRRTLCALFMSFLSIALAAPAWAATGGPDQGGYGWADSDEESVTYEWIDNSAGDRLTLGDDQESAPIELPFAFEVYGTTYSFVYVGSNGYLSFQSNDLSAGFAGQCPLPNEVGPNGALYGFYQDLNPAEASSGEIYYSTLGMEPERMFVVTFDGIDYYLGDEWESDPVTFQMVLYEGSNEMQVNVMDPSALAGGPRWDANTTIGIEDETGTMGIGTCPGMGMIRSEYSVRFSKSDGLGLFPARQTQVAVADAMVPFDYTLSNFGDAEVVATIAASSSSGWDLALSDEALTVPAQGSVDFSLDLTVPSGAQPGHSETVTVTVTVGGETLQSLALVRLRHTADAWQAIAPLPQALAHTQLVAADGKLFAMGGDYLDAATEAYVPVATTWSWSPEDNTWRDDGMTDLPAAATQGSACAMDGKIFYLGGFDGSAADGTHWSFQPALLIYDPASDSWSEGAAPPAAVALASVACEDGKLSELGKLYAVGGWADLDGDGDFVGLPDGGDTTQAVLWIYNANTDSWAEGPAPETGQSAAACGIADGKLIVAGGFFDDIDDPESIWITATTSIYDLETETWSEGGDLPQFIFHAAGVVFDGMLCAFGGEGNEGLLDAWFCYADEVWLQETDRLNLARRALAGAVLDGQVYLAGGSDESGEASDMAERWPTADLPDPQATDGGVDAGGEEDAGTGTDAGTEEDAGSGTDAGAQTDGGGTDDSDGGGCACTAAGQGSAGLLAWVLGLLALAGVRRRRQAS